MNALKEELKTQEENLAKKHALKHGLENFNKGQYEQALKDFKTAQEIGIGLGSAYLAKMYLEGKGVKVDYKKAQIYAQNAIKEHGSGMLGGVLILGQMQAEGLGMKKDLKKALNNYRQVVLALANKGTKGLTSGAGLIGGLVGSKIIDLSGLNGNPEDFKTKFSTYLAKTDKVMNFNDSGEVMNNINLLRQEMGEILYRIGIAYKEGLGTKKKESQAKKFLQKATEFGYEKAMEAL
ncbi:SEL1-like repeat protein [Helicobacter cetorum]|uniref:beta-lactamase n=1 Tax=Helicobacter cetorum (strain ATCC BAA-540 / CCUG 52418 / MIT 99-5656) TaxID=1163745 RepID=I0ETL3_HELCM|nr:tetratricopeptide repeat protein [Helicobacter cetorum]AFI06282.1 hypothetical protein HCD_06400 [Helicobacter cetorum MIT 99-5656]